MSDKLLITIGKDTHRLKEIQMIVSYDVMSGAPEYEILYLDNAGNTKDKGDWKLVE